MEFRLKPLTASLTFCSQWTTRVIPRPSLTIFPPEALEVIIRQHHEQLAALRVSHAAHLATVKKVARQRLVWAVIEAILLLAVIGWFIWDLTHPEIGLIRLKQSGYLGRILISRR